VDELKLWKEQTRDQETFKSAAAQAEVKIAAMKGTIEDLTVELQKGNVAAKHQLLQEVRRPRAS
jgi:hypothetical protein